MWSAVYGHLFINNTYGVYKVCLLAVVTANKKSPSIFNVLPGGPWLAYSWSTHTSWRSSRRELRTGGGSDKWSEERGTINELIVLSLCVSICQVDSTRHHVSGFLTTCCPHIRHLQLETAIYMSRHTDTAPRLSFKRKSSRAITIQFRM